MGILVLVFHPDITYSRINKYLAKSIESNKDITVRYLYDEYPDEKINFKLEQEILETYNRIILQFPFYWYSGPSLLKKWQDEVLTYGWAFGSKGNKLHGKELFLCVTVGVDESSYTLTGSYKYSVEELLRPFEVTARVIGTNYLNPFILYGVNKYTEEELKIKAIHYENYIMDN